MTVEEFKRPYTEAELKARFASEGFDAVLWQYCKESNEEIHCDMEQIEYNFLNDVEKEEDITNLLKEVDYNELLPVREEVWLLAMCPERVDAYMSQVKIGHGHQWAKIYSEKKDCHYENPILETYNVLHDKNATEANHEYRIYISSLPEWKNQVFRRAFLEVKGVYQTLVEVEDFASRLAYHYNNLEAAGCKSYELYEHAFNLADEDRDKEDIFYKAYLMAIEKGASPKDSLKFADKLYAIELNGNDDVTDTIKSFIKHFTEPWQREYYYSLLEKYWEKNEERISTLHKNEYRMILGLPPVKDTLTYNDEEYLRIKKELMEQGMPERLADEKAYKAAYECEEDTAMRLQSHNNRFDREMLEIMYPNEDIDDEDFNPAEFLDYD